MASETHHDHKLKSQSGSGFFYADSSATQYENQMQMFAPNIEVYNLQTGMEMMGPSWKNLPQRERASVPWKGHLDKGSSSKTAAAEPTGAYYHHQELGFSEPAANDGLLIAPESTWPENRLLLDDSSALRFVYPSDAGVRPSQGLSLSLSSNKRADIGLQSFEPIKESNHLHLSSNLRDGFYGKGSDFHSEYVQEGRSFSSTSSSSQQLKNSKYLIPAQQLLSEFCNLGTKERGSLDGLPKNKSHRSSQWEEGVSSRNPLYSLDLLELQKRKAKLASMLEEVDRRYRQYCEQMKAVVASFEAVAGHGSAAVYSSSASKAMSRHFRCLRDGIVGQIKATRKAMGEKDPVAPGTTKGETPRLKLLDQTIRQQKAFQQMGIMESHPWRPQRGLPERSVSVLRAWLFEHFLHPYPSDVDKHILARQTGLSRSQVSNWFINARVRLWKPMVEEMYMEETKEQDKSKHQGEADSGPQDSGRPDSPEASRPTHDLPPPPLADDQKPTADQLLRRDSDSLSSVVNQSIDQKQQPEPFGLVDLDFSSYSHENSAVTYATSEGGFPAAAGGGSANGVSLTLGLQHAGGGGLSFSPTGPQHSLFFSRQQMEECQPVQYSILNGESQNNLPYRNLMGSQLLRDLAG